MVRCLGIYANMRRRTCSHSNTATAEIHSHRKQLTVTFIHMWSVSAARRTQISLPHCIVLVNLFFCLNTVDWLYVVSEVITPLAGFLFIFTCSGFYLLHCASSRTPCSAHSFPSATWGRRENRGRGLSGSWRGAFRYSHFWQAASFCHMVFKTPLIPLITPRLLPGIYSTVFYVSGSGAENNDNTW